uniref:Uncharacterized protein n=1 Tax=Palpitomonas bilix TaxID=652834 RepID=A0A7S3LVG4_9EUKA|mmetsp:Transcript_49437/g.127413  ORF Transcript_49437/g.127413 Transcript_49437/m.127413 type:complete len:538 (+) Transcript_49437:107-1720(+)
MKVPDYTKVVHSLAWVNKIGGKEGWALTDEATQGDFLVSTFGVKELEVKRKREWKDGAQLEIAPLLGLSPLDQVNPIDIKRTDEDYPTALLDDPSLKDPNKHSITRQFLKNVSPTFPLSSLCSSQQLEGAKNGQRVVRISIRAHSLPQELIRKEKSGSGLKCKPDRWEKFMWPPQDGERKCASCPKGAEYVPDSPQHALDSSHNAPFWLAFFATRGEKMTCVCMPKPTTRTDSECIWEIDLQRVRSAFAASFDLDVNEVQLEDIGYYYSPCFHPDSVCRKCRERYVTNASSNESSPAQRGRDDRTHIRKNRYGGPFPPPASPPASPRTSPTSSPSSCPSSSTQTEGKKPRSNHGPWILATFEVCLLEKREGKVEESSLSPPSCVRAHLYGQGSTIKRNLREFQRKRKGAENLHEEGGGDAESGRMTIDALPFSPLRNNRKRRRETKTTSTLQKRVRVVEKDHGNIMVGAGDEGRGAREGGIMYEVKSEEDGMGEHKEQSKEDDDKEGDERQHSEVPLIGEGGWGTQRKAVPSRDLHQ